MSEQFTVQVEPITIVIVDSPERPLQRILEALSGYGYQLSTYCMAHVNMALLTTLQPDLILINLSALGVDSYQLCQRFCSQVALQDTAVFFVGGDVDQETAISALRSVASDYLSLPLQVEENALRIEKQIKLSREIRRLRVDNAGLSFRLKEHQQILQEQRSQQLSLARQNQELQRLVFVDGLTQITNRRGFNHHLTRLWQTLSQTQQPLSLILCDVDYFKLYNDTYGHLGGDYCLQGIASVLTEVVKRHTDVVARYGGEEFAVLLPTTSAQGAAFIAREIQTAMVSQGCLHAASLVSELVTLSMGIVSLVPRSTLSPKRLIQLADKALYAAKMQGRDRIIINNSIYTDNPVPIPQPNSQSNSQRTQSVPSVSYPLPSFASERVLAY